MIRNAPELGPLALCAVALATAACGDAGDEWSADTRGPIVARGLAGSVALIDAPTNRAIFLPVDGELRVASTRFEIGHGFAAAEADADGARLLVLSHGDQPRRRAEDQAPALAMFDGGTAPKLAARYELDDPFSGLVLDPAHRFAVIHPTEDDVSFVQNPNELVVVDLSRGPAADNPVPITLRSYGGRPLAMSFPQPLSLPGGVRRLLVVSTDRDLSLLDLDDLSRPDITVKLTTGADTVTPGSVAVDDGEPDRDDDARIAVRLADRTDVLVLDLLPAPSGQASPKSHGFSPVPNIVDVGGVPADIAFVRTDGGLRLAATVPSRQALALVDPKTGVSTLVDLGAPFERISIVTDIVGATDKSSDVALLWSAASANVAFVSLGATVGKPYKSVDRLELAEPVSEVLDVPPPNDHLKVLAARGGGGFVVLDLPARTAAPIASSSDLTSVRVARDGTRAWIVARNTPNVAALDFADLHPKNLTLTRDVSDVFDIARSDGGRALVAVHPRGSVGLTVLDAANPSLGTAREYAAVLLGELR